MAGNRKVIGHFYCGTLSAQIFTIKQKREFEDMPISKKWSDYNRETIEEKAPDSPGVYELGLSKENGTEIRYIGCTEKIGLRGRLKDHLPGASEPKPGCDKFRFRKVSSFLGIAVERPGRKEERHIQRFKEKHGRRPHFNNRDT